MSEYLDFLRTKEVVTPLRGTDRDVDINSKLFPHQRDTVEFLMRAGCGAAFLDTGLGKTAVELEYSRLVHEQTNRPVLILCPLAVAQQHKRESVKFGVDAQVIRNRDQIQQGINISNYEMLKNFSPSDFGGIVLDESSIIKSYGGKTSIALMQFAQSIDWRLAATATPAPNDHMELGQHSQFLGAMNSNEMLARWFIADQTEMGRYRLKRHGIKSFWSWVASWSRMIGRPSDMGYSDDGYSLPNLNVHRHIVKTNMDEGAGDGEMFRRIEMSATSLHTEKRRTAAIRAEKLRELVYSNDECWVLWCDTDYEADALTSIIPDAVEVRGSMSPEMKEQRLNDFSLGNIRVLVTKPSVAGFGLNWQHCSHTAFIGLSFSYESYYQAIRRFYRFGQQKEVHCHIAMAETELPIWQTVSRKADDHERMKLEMFAAMGRTIEARTIKNTYAPTMAANLPGFINAA